MKIVTIGAATTDIFLLHQNPSTLNFNTATEKRSFLLFEEGQKINLEQLIFHTGGGATNSAVSFKRLGFDVSTFFKAGNDLAATCILQHMNQEQINTSSVKQTNQHLTGHSFILPCHDGDRVVFTHRGANEYLTESDIPIETIKTSQYLYVTSLSGKAAHLLVPITQLAKQYNLFVAINPGSSQLSLGSLDIYQALPNIDIFILNSEEACTFMLSMVQKEDALHKKVLDIQTKAYRQQTTQGTEKKPQLLACPITYQSICFDLPLFFKEVIKRGPKIVVVTNGAEGVYVATSNQIIFHPSLPHSIVNTLGAGDAFGSCFSAQYIKGKSIEEAIVSGILNASSVIGQLGAKNGLLTAEQLATQYASTPKDLFQYFDYQN